MKEKQIKFTITITLPDRYFKNVRKNMELAISLLRLSTQSINKKIDFDVRTQIK